jgi:hypothetical protein
MIFAQREDLAGKLEVIVFPRTLEESRGLWFSGAKLVVEGRISTKDESIKLLAERVFRVEDFVKMIEEGSATKEYVGSGKQEGRSWWAKSKDTPDSNALPPVIDPVPKIPEDNGSKEIIQTGTLYINLDSSLNLGLTVPRLNLILGESLKGDVVVILKISNGDKKSEKELPTQYKINFTDKLKKRLEEILGPNRISWEE